MTRLCAVQYKHDKEEGERAGKTGANEQGKPSVV